jgi:hypothetical protein
MLCAHGTQGMVFRFTVAVMTDAITHEFIVQPLSRLQWALNILFIIGLGALLFAGALVAKTELKHQLDDRHELQVWRAIDFTASALYE